MVLYKADFRISEIRILTYRRDYGSQVNSRSWLGKFRDQDPDVDLVYGEDIDALSGATLSASSLVPKYPSLIFTEEDLKKLWHGFHMQPNTRITLSRKSNRI